MPEFITIDHHKIGRGEQRKIRLNIARLPTHTDICLPVHVYRAPQDGPVLLFTGGLHGDEINGIEIIRRMIEGGTIVPDRGTVIAMPLVNVYGFIQNSRDMPDGKDINRSFPGSKNGSLAKLFAHTLMNQIIPQIDYGVDFHTGGASRSNYPQVCCALNVNKNEELARAFAPPVILNSTFIDRSFRKSAYRKGKHILVYETGETQRFDEFGIQQGVDGARRLMKHLGLISKAPEPGIETTSYEHSTWVRAGRAGLFHSQIELGNLVEKQDVLGTITDPFANESFNTVCPRDGRIIGINNLPVVHKGDALIHLAYNKNQKN